MSSSLSPCLSQRFVRCTLWPSSGWNVELNPLFRLPGKTALWLISPLPSPDIELTRFWVCHWIYPTSLSTVPCVLEEICVWISGYYKPNIFSNHFSFRFENVLKKAHKIIYLISYCRDVLTTVIIVGNRIGVPSSSPNRSCLRFTMYVCTCEIYESFSSLLLQL